MKRQKRVRMWFVAWCSLLVLGVAGCSGDVSLGHAEWTDSFLQSASLSVDVLFVVDNSLSMQGPGQEHERVVAAFEDFVAGLEENKSEFHIGITTTDLDQELDAGGTKGRLKEFTAEQQQEACTGLSDGASQESCLQELAPYVGSRYITSDMSASVYQAVFQQLVYHLGEGSGWEKGLWAAKLALYPQSEGGNADGWNHGFMRSDAKLAIIFISDEDDCSDEGNPLPGEEQAECYTHTDQLRPVFEYVADYQALKLRDDDIILSAIVGPQNQGNDTDCGKNTSAGTRYINAVGAFDGVVGNICDTNFSGILNEMGLSAAGIRTHFVLSRVPDPDTIQVQVNGRDMPASEGWAYDEVSNAIDFFGDGIPPRDATILISYRLG